MKAFLLAAGCGTRLRPLTLRVPKCLVPIAGRPLLDWWFDLLVAHGVTDVLINSHYLHEQLVEHIDRYHGPLAIQLVHEPTLLGSAGTLSANRSFIDRDEDFLILYADNLTNVDLSHLIETHRRSDHRATLGLFHAPRPHECGIVQLDERNTIVEFAEKPQQPRGDLAFAGLIAASPALLDELPPRVPCDLGREVLPQLVGRLGGWKLDGYLRDIGTPESYVAAQHEALLLTTGAP